MKPGLSITTNIKVRRRYILNAFIRTLKIGEKSRAFIVSSHKAWILILLVAISATNLSATSVAVIVTPDFLIIASDSAVAHTNPKGGEVTRIEQSCKMMSQENIFYIGVGEYSAPNLRFDLY